MAGILNDKQRIMDLLLTVNGRRQIADGTFKIEFASFSDHGVFYREDTGGVADDAGKRLMFESYSSPSDTVIPEINSAGDISMDIFSGNDFKSQLVNGKLLTRETTDVDSEGRPKPRFVSGSINVYSSSDGVLQNAINSFDNLQIIGTKNNWADQDYFEIDKPEINFNRAPDSPMTEKFLDAMDPFFTNDSFASLPAFRYLAPVYDDPNSTAKIPLAAYRRMNNYPKLSFAKLKEELGKNQVEKVNLKSDDPYLNIVSQVFEINDDTVGKLAIIDYGTYLNEEGAEIGCVYHLGKVFRDSNNIPKFVKVLTIIFE
mgnify:CR=1 FL=1